MTRLRALTLRAGLTATLLVLGACGGSEPIESAEDQATTGADTELESVTFALNWLPVAETAGWYTALEKGWFEDVGLDVTIGRGFGSGDTVKRVATGEADIGTADLSAIVPLRLNEDVPVLIVSSYLAEVPQSVFFRTDGLIEEPMDLEGKSIATSANNANLLMFPAFAEANNIDEDSIEWVLVEPGSINSVFAAGDADAALGFIGSLPIIESLTEDAISVFQYSEYGVEQYATMFIASETTVAERPEMIDSFLGAAFRGLEYALENSEEAIDILLSHTPENDPEVTRAAWQYDQLTLANEVTERHGFGYIDPEQLRNSFETLVSTLELEDTQYEPEDLYTTAFQP